MNKSYQFDGKIQDVEGIKGFFRLGYIRESIPIKLGLSYRLIPVSPSDFLYRLLKIRSAPGYNGGHWAQPAIQTHNFIGGPA
jgi:hypothetical protein